MEGQSVKPVKSQTVAASKRVNPYATAHMARHGKCQICGSEVHQTKYCPVSP